MASILPSVFAVLFVINAANGLICYKCNSKDNVGCKWGISSFTYKTEECTSAGIFDTVFTPKCYKITAQNKKGKEFIARGCLPPATNGCSAIAKTIGWIASSASNDPNALKNLKCETCKTNKCNSANKLAGFAFIGIILSSIVFLL